jgi:hypothetical protein
MADMTPQDAANYFSRDITECEGIISARVGPIETVLAKARLTASKMALAALEAQEPRVLKRSEVDAIINESAKHYFPCSFIVETKDGQLTFLVWGYCITFGKETYGATWRIWNKWPTAEQMAATPWDGKKDDAYLAATRRPPNLPLKKDQIMALPSGTPVVCSPKGMAGFTVIHLSETVQKRYNALLSWEYDFWMTVPTPADIEAARKQP